MGAFWRFPGRSPLLYSSSEVADGWRHFRRGAGLHSRTIEVLDQRGIAGSALNDIFVLDGADEWRARIEASVTDPAAQRDRADAVRAHIVAQNPRARRGSLAQDSRDRNLKRRPPAPQAAMPSPTEWKTMSTRAIYFALLKFVRILRRAGYPRRGPDFRSSVSGVSLNLSTDGASKPDRPGSGLRFICRFFHFVEVTTHSL